MFSVVSSSDTPVGLPRRSVTSPARTSASSLYALFAALSTIAGFVVQNPVITVLAIAFAVCLMVLLVRSVRARVETDGESIAAYADRFTRRIDCAQVHKIENTGSSISAVLHDGTTVRLADVPIWRSKATDRAVTDMQAWIPRRR
jgi:hypothetical protein